MLLLDGKEISQTMEAEMVFTRYLYELKSIDSSLFIAEKDTMEMKHNNILFCFPYWLTDAFHSTHAPNVLRALTLGNLFGRWYIVAQDRIIDRQNSLLPELNHDRVLLLSNLVYYKWIKEYQRIFPAHSRFWLFFEKYLLEYSQSVLWEKKEHWGKLQDFQECDLKYLGQKLSPLKISGAGMCMLNNRFEMIPLLSELIDQWQIGFQFWDDIKDWHEDLRNKNYTYFLTKIHLAASSPVLSEQEIENVLLTSTIKKDVLEKSMLHYSRAKEIAEQLSLKQISAFIDALIRLNEKELSGKHIPETEPFHDSESVLDHDVVLRKNDVHCFENNGHYYVFDVRRHFVFTIDRTAFEVLQLLDSINGSTLRGIIQSAPAVSPDDAADIIQELIRVCIIRTVDRNTEELVPHAVKLDPMLFQKKYEQIVNLEMQISTGSPHHQRMSVDVAKHAVNLFFLNQRDYEYRGNHTVFLSCAVMGSDEADIIQRVVEYSMQLGIRLKKTIHFMLSTSLMHTNNDVLLQCLGMDALKSIIFSADCSDVVAFSKRSDAQQTAALMKNCQKPVRINLAFDDNSENLKTATDIIRAFGFENILLQPSGCQTQSGCSDIPDARVTQYEDNNHFYFLNSLRLTARTAKHNPCISHCSAGRTYLSIAPDGTIYPCSRFAGYSQYSLGNVFTNIGTNQDRYMKRHVQSLELCYNCWLRFICGGGCMFRSQLVTGSLETPDKQWCRTYEEQVERSISRYYTLIPEERKKLDETANLDIRYCDAW